jgi:tryptophan halogenase
MIDIKTAIIGSGTAGLVGAMMLRSAFPLMDITVISSSQIGIIGVGEGSTEHWRMFMDACNIPLGELLNETKATHKNGIRFENWTNHTPDYFHSVSDASTIGYYNFYGLYNGLIENNKTLTENISSRAMIENKVRANGPHESVNQFHFDTVLLNNYLTRLCQERNICFIDSKIIQTNLNNENGHIESVLLENGDVLEAGFWIDASGMSRVLISEVSDAKWKSFSNYLQMNSAIPFPTQADPSGEIRPYTRARAIQNGWVWEIPTQERRGNGYVYSSNFCSDDQAISEVSALLGFQVQPVKTIKFDPGHLEEMWVKNCVAIGLSSAFVEPIEASSIGGTIQQMRCLVENLSSYKIGHKAVQNQYNKKMNIMMQNILSMIYLHYISDRRDTEMWINQANTPVPEYLQNLLDLWSERPPFYNDIPTSNYEMFHVPHFYHVAQGQKVLSQEASSLAIYRFNIRDSVKTAMYSAKIRQSDHEKVDHAQSLKEIQL